MSINEMRMSVLSESIAKAITGRTSAVEGVEKKKGQFEDTMFSLGLRSAHTISPKGKDSERSLSTPECFEQIKGAIIEGFPAAAKRLMLTPTKALDDADKEAKRAWQQRVGANLRDLGNALKRREIDAGEIEPAEKAKKTPAEQILQHLLNAANTARKIEEAGFDVVEFVKQCEGAAILVSPDGVNVIRGNQD
jgi:hypothetical protein